jgi:hypothetical protein
MFIIQRDAHNKSQSLRDEKEKIVILWLDGFLTKKQMGYVQQCLYCDNEITDELKQKIWFL